MSNENQLSSYIENLDFVSIFKSFRMAIQPSKLIIALLAILTVVLIGSIMDIFKVVYAAPGITQADVAMAPMEGIATASATELQAYVISPDAVGMFKERYGSASSRLGLFSTLATFCAARFNDTVFDFVRFNPAGALTNMLMSVRAIMWALFEHPLISLPYFILLFIVFAFAGGAISRIAALEFAKDEKPGFFQALRFARAKFKSFIAAPLAPILLIFILGFIIFIFGALGNVPYAGEILVAMLLILAIVLSFLITLLIIGLLAGFNLMYPAISYEGSDSFDAISRSFSYVYARPWRMGFYSILAAIYGALCYLFVFIFATILLWSSYIFLALGMAWSHSSKAQGMSKLEGIWSVKMPTLPTLFDFSGLNWTEAAAALIISIIVTIVLCITAAFAISFFFSANTAIYALMRKKVDNTLISEVWTPSQIESEEMPVTIEDLPKDDK
jgi:hypothetical protein